jgi:ubiquinone/menaquinone biosynthesis C-methylase UbiE
MDYNKMHCDWAMTHQSVEGASVLVVGCNTGLDCAKFVDAGAKQVHGLDIDEAIGCDYQHSNVLYFRASAENMPLKSNTYDLVFCFATMEHIPDVYAAFNEIARVTKPGGLVYCVASPLWNSRYGHHYPQYFSDFPWIHLRCDQEEVQRYLIENDVPISPQNISAEVIAEYMFHPENFNRTPSTDYINACSKLTGFEILRNDLDLEPENALPEDIRMECEAKGYSSRELRAVTHTFIARKKVGDWTDALRKFMPQTWRPKLVDKLRKFKHSFYSSLPHETQCFL